VRPRPLVLREPASTRYKRRSLTLSGGPAGVRWLAVAGGSAGLDDGLVDRFSASERRAVHGIESASRAALDPDTLHVRIFEEFAPLLALTGLCWHRTDPVSGIPVAGGRVGEPPGSFARSLEFEFLRPDYARFASVMRRPRPVAALSAETGGELRRSPRYREMIAPAGARDELRVAWVDPFGRWGTCILFAERLFDERALTCFDEVRRAVARSLRLARTREGSALLDHQQPGVVVVDGHGRIQATDETAHQLLATAARRPGPDLPDTVTILAVLARRRDPAHPATTRLPDGAGGWLTLDAVALDGVRCGEVAVVVQPATTDSVLADLLRAYGLSERERQVALLVAAGRANRDVAVQLGLSPWTVQDHVKHVYAKTGVGGRGELSALVVRRAAGG
jgi:DNA-binding CsgD family transcriptional regulator